MQLKGQVVAITGAFGALGSAVVKAVLAEGAQVAAREPFGMKTGDNDNIAFARNVIAWLAGPASTAP